MKRPQLNCCQQCQRFPKCNQHLAAVIKVGNDDGGKRKTVVVVVVVDAAPSAVMFSNSKPPPPPPSFSVAVSVVEGHSCRTSLNVSFVTPIFP